MFKEIYMVMRFIPMATTPELNSTQKGYVWIDSYGVSGYMPIFESYEDAFLEFPYTPIVAIPIE